MKKRRLFLWLRSLLKDNRDMVVGIPTCVIDLVAGQLKSCFASRTKVVDKSIVSEVLASRNAKNVLLSVDTVAFPTFNERDDSPLLR